MSRLTLNTNVNALLVNRHFSSSTQELQETFKRLSSGLRINSAADDAAGLAIAEAIKADRRVFAQGVRNLNDGISLLNIADGTITELTNIVDRIRELATQSSNGTLSNSQRKSLDAEAQALTKEFNRIARSTEFNGAAIFDSDFGTLSLQAGYGTDGRLASDLGGAIGDGTFSTAFTYVAGNATDVQHGDFNSDGNIDLVFEQSDGIFVMLGLGNGGFSSGSSYNFASGSGVRNLVTSDLNGDGILDVAEAGASGELNILFGNGDGSFGNLTLVDVGSNTYRGLVAEDFNGDGIMDLAAPEAGSNTVRVVLGTGGGSFSSATSYTIGAAANPRAMSSGDFNGDGIVDLITADNDAQGHVSVFLGTGDGSFGAAQRHTLTPGDGAEEIVTGDFNQDGRIDAAVANLSGDAVTVLLGAGDGTFSSSSRLLLDSSNQPRALATGDLNGDGILDLVSGEYSDSVSVFLGNGDGSFSNRTSFDLGGTDPNPNAVTLADVNNDGVLDIITSNNVDNTTNIMLGNTNTGVSALLPFSLKYQFEALQAMPILDRTLERLSLQRGTIGSFQSRVDVATSNLQSMAENLADAESRIMDADVALEAARLVRLNILQQAGAAVLGQANSSARLALTLLDDE